MSATGDKADTPLGKDAKLRQAFELAIDRNVINRVAFNGEFLADNQMIPPSIPFYAKRHTAPARDVAKAKALIADAGMTTVPMELSYENSLARRPCRADHAVDGERGGLRRQAAAAGDDDRDRALSGRQFRSLYRQLERPRRSRTRR